MGDKPDESGLLVYPQLPVPKQRMSAPKVKGFKDGGGGGGGTWKLVAGLVVGLGGGAAAGYFLAPKKIAELANVQKQAAALETATKVEKDRADAAQKQVDVLTKDKQKLEKQLAVATKTAKEAEGANAAAEKKLQSAVDKSAGEVSTEGEEIHLKLVDKVLFKVGDDQLTAKGKAVLAKVGKALVDLPDKQVWVQGHTDDTPIVIPPAPKPKRGKPAKPVVPPRFASNWELSAARALQVVHYLQDVAKIEPERLAALAFGEYRPVSKSNKAQNRRIEIVLYPHKAVIERAKKK